MSDTTNRVVRLAKAHTDLALPVCRIPVDQICLVSYGDASGGGIHAEQAKIGYMIMLADMSLLAGLASPVTSVPWRSHSVKRFVASATAAEVMGLSEAFAQGGWVRALWSENCVGAESARMARTKRSATSHIGHGLKGELRLLAQ